MYLEVLNKHNVLKGYIIPVLMVYFVSKLALNPVSTSIMLIEMFKLDHEIAYRVSVYCLPLLTLILFIFLIIKIDLLTYRYVNYPISILTDLLFLIPIGLVTAIHNTLIRLWGRDGELLPHQTFRSIFIDNWEESKLSAVKINNSKLNPFIEAKTFTLILVASTGLFFILALYRTESLAIYNHQVREIVKLEAELHYECTVTPYKNRCDDIADQILMKKVKYNLRTPQPSEP